MSFTVLTVGWCSMKLVNLGVEFAMVALLKLPSESDSVYKPEVADEKPGISYAWSNILHALYTHTYVYR